MLDSSDHLNHLTCARSLSPRWSLATPLATGTGQPTEGQTMAYMTGPYPNKAGEFCGNHHPTYDTARPEMRWGRPRPCKAGTTEEMEAQGFVGLYLKEDQPILPWQDNATAIPTPPELMEPAPA